MKYIFDHVVFTPNNPVKLTVNGEPVSLPNKQVQLLKFFVDNCGKIFTKQQVLDAVWGEGEHSFNALNIALTKLNSNLPTPSQIVYIKNEGHIFDNQVTRTEPRFKKLEKTLENSKKAWALFSLIGLLTLFFAFNTIETIYYWFSPPVSYQVDNKETAFTRDHLVSNPQLSPDGRFIAHKLSTNAFVDDYLGLYEVEWDDTRPLVPMGFNSGFRWNIAGDKIVYQNLTQTNCEIRLLSFHPDKTIKNNQLLRPCEATNGRLSFAWFNEAEFYVNLGSIDTNDSPNRLPQHDLYSFNINTLQTFKLEESDYTGGVGFYSLEYDLSTQTLYLLQTTDFITTRFYRYKAEQLSEVAEIDYLVRFYSAGDNRLVIQNNKDQLMINQPAEDFAGQKRLLTTSNDYITRPHHIGDTLIYLAGDRFSYAAYQWHNSQLKSLKLAGFSPLSLSNFNGQLVFVAARGGRYQVYMVNEKNKPIQISRFKKRQYISHIDAKNDLFALSFRGKVEVYRYNKTQLHLIKSLANYTNGVLSPDGKNLLVTKSTKKTKSSGVIELSLSDFKSTGLKISGARFALYHQQQLLYLNESNELIMLANSQAQVIAKNIDVNSIAKTSLHQNDFYYIDQKASSRSIASINLNNGERNLIKVGNLIPLKLSVIDDKLTIVAWKSLQPKIITSTITQY